jgi:glycosyltransferase involved in cell wall biosynthesis
VINTVKMAQGFARLGHEVTIICRQAPEGIVSSERLAQIYGITEPLDWVQLPDRVLHYQIRERWRFALLALPIVLRKQPDLVFVRNHIFPWLSSKLGMATVAESHLPVGTETARFLRLVAAAQHRAFRLWVTISDRLVSYYQSQGVPEHKLIVLADAVDLQLFQRPEALPPSPYPSSQANVAYVGHLYDYKGIPTILEAAAQLPKAHFHFIGGLPADLQRQRQRSRTLKLPNVSFHGLKPQVEVPHFLWHADVLLLPPSQHHPSAAWTSPVKLGEYLAAGTPVVATDIPALRDWLTDRDVEFVPPDDPTALAEGIQRLLQNQDRAEQLRVSGLQKAQALSYEQRAAAVLNASGFPAR